MKKTEMGFLALAAAGLLLAGVSARADEPTLYRARPLGSTVRLEGAANVHDWKMDGTIIGGKFEVPAGVTIDSTQGDVAGAADGKIAAKAEVDIPVSSLKSEHEGMDEVMQAAMDAINYPRIQFRLTSLTVKGPHTAGTPIQFEASGDLSFHGVTNQITMPVKIETVDKTKLKISAAQVPVNMKDFKVRPPVKLGLFVTEPEVKITFNWIVGVRKPVETK